MLAYCPLDLPKLEVDEDLVRLFVDEYNPGHHDGIWRTLPLVGRVEKQEDFLNAVKFEEAWERRYDYEGNVFYNELARQALQPIFDHLQLLPMLVTHAQILNATRNVPKHHDMKHKKGAFINNLPRDSYEPGGWKIQLNKTNEQSFFVCKDWESDPNYIQMPKDTNTFVINEKSFPHGSDYVEDKCIVSIFGIVRKNEADALIKRSEEKYKNYAIWY